MFTGKRVTDRRRVARAGSTGRRVEDAERAAWRAFVDGCAREYMSRVIMGGGPAILTLVAGARQYAAG